MIAVNETNINAFLHFGWLPRTDVNPPIPTDWIPEKNVKYEISSSDGADILRSAVKKSLGASKKVTIPLSGGLDSRLLLAVAHELGYEIATATLGVPGTYDYEIGRLVARKMNIEHHPININEAVISTETLVSYAKRIGDWTNILETAYSLQIADRFSDTKIVSGFLGDFTAGAYAHLNKGNWSESKRLFCLHNKVVRHIKVTDKYDPLDSLPEERAFSNQSRIGDYEELVLRVRHTCSLRPSTFTDTFGFVTPFLDKAWIKYIFEAPNHLRHKQNLYHKILTKNWPNFFDLPTATYKGLPLQHSKLQYRAIAYSARGKSKFRRLLPTLGDTLFGIDPMNNYTDFHNQLKRETHIKHIAEENLSDLEKRDIVPWINLKKKNQIWFNEESKISPADGALIILLTNLEINLKATD